MHIHDISSDSDLGFISTCQDAPAQLSAPPTFTPELLSSKRRAETCPPARPHPRCPVEVQRQIVENAPWVAVQLMFVLQRPTNNNNAVGSDSHLLGPDLNDRQKERSLFHDRPPLHNADLCNLIHRHLCTNLHELPSICDVQDGGTLPLTSDTNVERSTSSTSPNHEIRSMDFASPETQQVCRRINVAPP